MAKENTKSVSKPISPAPQRAPGDTLDAAVLNTAPKMLKGGEYFGREEYVINQMSSYYGVTKEEAEEKLKKAVDALPKPPVTEEDKEKIAAADRAAEKAAEAKRFAEEAADLAQRAAEEAAALAAEAQGLVLVDVPSSFYLMHEGKKIHVTKGTTKLPRALAEHRYSKASGVTILGTPTKNEAK